MSALEITGTVFVSLIIVLALVVIIRQGKRQTKFNFLLEFFGIKAKIESEAAPPSSTDQQPVLPSPPQPHIPPIEIKVSTEGAAATALPPPQMQTTAQLPRDLDDFTGRQKEFDELVKLLSGRGGCATISAIGGMGGVGKSALAYHVGHAVKDHYPDGQIVVNMAGTSDNPLSPTDGMASVIRSFEPERQVPEDIDAAADIYNTLLSSKRALIVLDNALDAAQVAKLIPPEPCAVIVTSRNSIKLPGVTSYDLDALSVTEARDFLRELTGEVSVADEQLDEIAELCARLPLALRAAGAALAPPSAWSVNDYIEALRDERQRLGRLRAGNYDVEAVLGTSASQLVREQSELAERWQMLTVFPATFDLLAVAVVWEASEDAARDGIDVLLKRGLLIEDSDTDGYKRFRLHDLMRLVAQNAFGYGDTSVDENEQEQRMEGAALRHAGYYQTLLDSANSLYEQGGEALMQGLALYDRERANIEAGQAWAAERAEADDEAATLCNAYPGAGAHVLELRRHPHERINWLEAALSAARRLKTRGPESVHLANLGIAYSQIGEPRRAIGHHEQALVISREIGDRRAEGQDLGNLGIAYAQLSEPRHAIEQFEQRLEIAREIGDRRGEGNALGNLGNVYTQIDEPRHAIEHHEQALVISREIGNRRAEGNDLSNMALALDELGNLEQAIANAEAALEIYEQIEDPNAERIRQILEEWRGQG